MIEEGQIVEFNGKKYFVDFVEYTGSYVKPMIKVMTLRGIIDDQ